MRIVARISLVLTLAGLVGCGGTAMLRSYNDPTAEGKPIGRIAVLAFHPNAEKKAEFEGAFASYLRERGNDAVEANTLGSGVLDPTRDALRALVEAEGLGGVLTVMVLRENPNEVGQAEKTAYRPDRDGDLYEYFFRSKRSMVPDGAAASRGLIYLEGRLYATRNAQVAWGGLSSSDDNENLAEFTKRYADAAVFEMAAKGYVK